MDCDYGIMKTELNHVREFWRQMSYAQQIIVIGFWTVFAVIAVSIVVAIVNV